MLEVGTYFGTEPAACDRVLRVGIETNSPAIRNLGDRCACIGTVMGTCPTYQGGCTLERHVVSETRLYGGWGKFPNGHQAPRHWIAVEVGA